MHQALENVQEPSNSPKGKLVKTKCKTESRTEPEPCGQVHHKLQCHHEDEIYPEPAEIQGSCLKAHFDKSMPLLLF